MVLAPEQRHRIYKRLRLNVYARPNWPLEITGVFAGVAVGAIWFVVLQTFTT